MEFYILQIGKKYYHYNKEREGMTLIDSIDLAYQYNRLEDLKSDLEWIEKNGKYKNKKRRILHAKCNIEEIEI